MMKQLVKIGAVALVGLGVAIVAGEASARELSGWKIEGSGASAQVDTKYKLYNLDQGTRVVFDDRVGANWGWNAGTAPNVELKRKGGSGPLKCGETFALMINGRAMIYAKQDWGINLSDRTKLDKDEYYQWKFSCAAGQPVPLNGAVTLVNNVEKDSLVGCKRTAGVNLCWADDITSIRGKNYRTADAKR